MRKPCTQQRSSAPDSVFCEMVLSYRYPCLEEYDFFEEDSEDYESESESEYEDDYTELNAEDYDYEQECEYEEEQETARSAEEEDYGWDLEEEEFEDDLIRMNKLAGFQYNDDGELEYLEE